MKADKSFKGSAASIFLSEKIKFGIIVLSGILLTGCQKEAGVELQQADVEENAVVSEAETAEGADTGADADSNSEETEDVLQLSVLGKTELLMEYDRIYDKDGELRSLSNCFTSEETDMILDTVQGIWEIDACVGFVPYDIYIGSGRGIAEGREEEKQEKYERAVEAAKTDIPDFSFRIKVYNAAGEEPGNGGQYIYVKKDGDTYASPVGIDLCMGETDDAYLEFAGETLQGVETASDSGYPIICIRFFICSYSEKEGREYYEPATLILASDGQILLFKDGAFYLVKSSIQSEIMNGDFRRLGVSDDFKEHIEKYYNLWKDRGIPEVEWQIIDLNGDGIEDLILQNKDTIGIEKEIIGIFACEEDRAKCMEWDLNDMTEYSFCGSTGELMYTAPNYGGIVDNEPYVHYYYDKEWNKVEDYSFEIIRIDSGVVDEEYAEIWKEEHPDFAEDGIYYRKYTEGRVEVLTREQVEEIYETATGYELHSVLISYSERLEGKH